MAWLLDTNAWIQFLKPGQAAGQSIANRLSELEDDDVRLCAVVKAELWHGAEKYSHREIRQARLAEVFGRYRSLPFDDVAARRYALIRHELETRGLLIGPNDLMIAAICRAHGLTLVSSNTDEFSRVSGLKVEDWSRA